LNVDHLGIMATKPISSFAQPLVRHVIECYLTATFIKIVSQSMR